MDNDLISRDTLKKATKELYNETLDAIVKFGIEKAYDLIDTVPTVEASQGEWITEYDYLKCPFCGMSIDDEVHYLYPKEYGFNYCPNCGAKLKGGSNG